MKIIAGGRGSGKTYELIHLAAEDPNGLFVAKDPYLARYLREEYRKIISSDRIILQTDLVYPYKFRGFRGLGTEYPLNIYVDDIPSGYDIPDAWMHDFRLKAIAVQPKSMYENEFLPDSYIDAVTKMEKERRDQKKSEEVDKA